MPSISSEIVGQNFAKGVIPEAHVLGNDGISFYSCGCGRRNSLQEGFFDKLTAAIGGRFIIRKLVDIFRNRQKKISAAILAITQTLL